MSLAEEQLIFFERQLNTRQVSSLSALIIAENRKKFPVVSERGNKLSVHLIQHDVLFEYLMCKAST